MTAHRGRSVWAFHSKINGEFVLQSRVIAVGWGAEMGLYRPTANLNLSTQNVETEKKQLRNWHKVGTYLFIGHFGFAGNDVTIDTSTSVSRFCVTAGYYDNVVLRAYQVRDGPKNWRTFLYALTLCALTSSNIDRFSNLFHCLNQENICNRIFHTK